jgi:hypothetical protein
VVIHALVEFLCGHGSVSGNPILDIRRIRERKVTVVSRQSSVVSSQQSETINIFEQIISIPLEGDLEHRDSMGNVTVIRHGDITVDGSELNTRDGLGIWDTKTISLVSNSPDAEVLLMEVPMQ